MHSVRMVAQENRLSFPGRITPADYAAAIGPLGRGWIADAGGVDVGFARQLWLTTDPGTRAEAFYRSLGWRPCGIVPDGELRLELDKS